MNVLGAPIPAGGIVVEENRCDPDLLTRSRERRREGWIEGSSPCSNKSASDHVTLVGLFGQTHTQKKGVGRGP